MNFSRCSCFKKVFSFGFSGLFFALVLVFSPVAAEAQTKFAKDVVATDEEQVKAFLKNIADYYNKNIGTDPQMVRINLSEITRVLRTNPMYRTPEDTPKNNNMYTILIEDHFGVVFNHIAYPELYGHRFDKDGSITPGGSDPEKALKHLIVNSSEDVNDIECIKYIHDSKERYACGVKVRALSKMTLVAGLHHDNKGETEFSGPPCDSFEDPEFTAKDLYDDPTDENLKSYVKSFIKSAQGAVLSEVKKLHTEDGNLFTNTQRRPELLGKVHALINSLATCVQDDSLKHKNIYAFIMSANEKGTVLANGNNLNLNGLNFDLKDEGLEGEDKKVVNYFRAELLKNACGEATQEIEAGNCANVTYRWDDPQIATDNVDNWLEMNKVPGTSLKKSYIEVAKISADVTEALNVDLDNAPVIFGSGFYPESQKTAPSTTKDDDDGCAIAGTEHTHQNTLANMLLMVSVLLSIVFLRRRA